MSVFEKMSRRELIRNFGLVAFFAQPLLRSIASAQNAASAPLRFVNFYKSVGFMEEEFWPTAGFNFNTTTNKSLQAIRGDIRLFKNLDLGRDGGNAHGRGMGVLFTGTQADIPPSGKATDYTHPKGVSIDQTIARLLVPRYNSLIPSLQLGVGLQPEDGINRTSYLGNGNYLTPEESPAKAFANIMDKISAICNQGSNQNDSIRQERLQSIQRKKSLLDYNLDHFNRFERKFGLVGEEKIKMEGAVERFRAMERDLAVDQELLESIRPGSARPCPTVTNNNGRDDRTQVSDANIRDQIRIIQMAFDWNLTQVATLQMGGAQSASKYTQTGISVSHHGLTHGNLQNLNALKIVDGYLMSKYVQLVQSLKEITDSDGRNVLYNSTVLLGTETVSGPKHGVKDMPFILAGRAKGFLERPGQRITLADRRNHQDLLFTLAKLHGYNGSSYGDRDKNKGVIGELID